MPNEYGAWTRNHRPTAEQGWRVTSEAQEIFRGVDRLDRALELLGVDVADPANGTLADWQAPLVYHNTANTAWATRWLDGSGAATGVVWRTKIGASLVAATPSGETDGTIEGFGGMA